MKLPDDRFVAATRRLMSAQSSYDLEFVFSPEAADFDPYYVRSLNYHLAMIPWIETSFPLAEANVIEIGCGGGAATMAMAHRCAWVDAFDIDAASLSLAAARSKEHGLTNVGFHALDPDWAKAGRGDDFVSARSRQYDVVLLPAVLEHMTIEERLQSLDALWRVLRPDGAMIVYDTPNRLYPYDVHSFRLPFFDWIPEEIAIRYAAQSSRLELPQMLDAAQDKSLALHRIGRGVSYHEFDLAIGLGAFEVLNDGYSALLTHRKRNTVYEGLLSCALQEFAPHVPLGFGKTFLDLVLRKKWNKAVITSRHNAVDDISPYGKPYVRMEGGDASLSIELGGEGGKLRVETWNHGWSGTLVVFDESGAELHAENLYSPYQRGGLVEAALPAGRRRVRLGLRPSEGSQGVQAWIMGFGSA